MLIRICSIVVATVSLTVQPLGARAGTDEAARFKQEYPAAAKRIEAHFGQMKGVCRITAGQKRGRQSQSKASFAIDNAMRIVEVTKGISKKETPAGDHEEVVYCDGDRAGFCLTRSPKSDKYSIFEVGPSEMSRGLFTLMCGRFLEAPFAILGERLAQQMGSEAFDLVSAETVNFDDRKCLKVVYKFGPPAQSLQDTVILDPDNGWVIRQAEHHVSPTGPEKITVEVEYKPSDSAIPTPRLVKVVEPNGETTTWDFEQVSFEPTPENHFSMTRFSLPGAVEAKPDSSRWGWTLILGGCAAVGFLGAFALKRLAAGQAS